MGIRAYIALFLLLAFMGLGLVAYHYKTSALEARAEAAQAISDRDTAIAANKAQEATIGRLRASAEANDRIVAQMAEQVAAINDTTAQTSEDIGKLKDANNDVRAWLNGLVPPDAERLLNK